MKKMFYCLIGLVLIAGFFYFFPGIILKPIGSFLIRDDIPDHAEAAVVLSSGVDYYPRLIEASILYKSKTVDMVVINGGRSTETIRKLEEKGFQWMAPWYADSMNILSLLGVPRRKVIKVKAENAYDTVSEAGIVGKSLSDIKISSIIVVTSKFHTKRAGYIWSKLFSKNFKIQVMSAKEDPFDPANWWRSGRQARQVLTEYGAWMYLFWKLITSPEGD